MSEADKLLIAIGAAGKMSIESFNNLFINLYLKLISEELDEDYHNSQWTIVRLLDSLGYCEFDFDKREVFPCPPAIVSLPGGGLRRAVLTGVRSPSIMEKIKKYTDKYEKTMSVVQEAQKIKFYSYSKEKYVSLPFPSTVLFEYFDEEVMVRLAHEIGVQSSVKVPASWALATYSIGLKEYRERTVWGRTRQDEVNWNKRYFNPEKFVFSKSSFNGEKTHLVEYQDPCTKQKEHWLWEGDIATVIDRDWGKYEVLARMSKKVFLYDAHHHALAVPSYLPLPRLLSRAITMCSGKVPITADLRDRNIGNVPSDTQVTIYHGVPPEYVSIVSSKLLQDPVKCTIEVEENGVKIS